MSLFHDEEDKKPEPIPGLPEELPEGETVLWQGKPAALAFTINTFRLRWIAVYVTVFLTWRLANAATTDAGISQGMVIETLLTASAFTLGGVSIFLVLGAQMARSTIYTLTNRRLVMRYGVGFRKYINLPFSRISSASLKAHGGKTGSIAFETDRAHPLPYFHLWPHARPFRFVNASPMFRAIADPEGFARLLATTMKEAKPEQVSIERAILDPGTEKTAQPTHGGRSPALAT